MNKVSLWVLQVKWDVSSFTQSKLIDAIKKITKVAMMCFMFSDLVGHATLSFGYNLMAASAIAIGTRYIVNIQVNHFFNDLKRAVRGEMRPLVNCAIKGVCAFYGFQEGLWMGMPIFGAIVSASIYSWLGDISLNSVRSILFEGGRYTGQPCKNCDENVILVGENHVKKIE